MATVNVKVKKIQRDVGKLFKKMAGETLHHNTSFSELDIKSAIEDIFDTQFKDMKPKDKEKFHSFIKKSVFGSDGNYLRTLNSVINYQKMSKKLTEELKESDLDILTPEEKNIHELNKVVKDTENFLEEQIKIDTEYEKKGKKRPLEEKKSIIKRMKEFSDNVDL